MSREHKRMWSRCRSLFQPTLVFTTPHGFRVAFGRSLKVPQPKSCLRRWQAIRYRAHEHHHGIQHALWSGFASRIREALEDGDDEMVTMEPR
jgi:hypothetical protein